MKQVALPGGGACVNAAVHDDTADDDSERKYDV